MSHLKQILHNIYIRISKTTSTIKTGLLSLGLAPLNYQFLESLKQTALSLMWLVIMLVYLVATSILNLSWAIGLTLKKLARLLKISVWEVSSVQYIVCHLVDAVKSIISTFKRLPKYVWSGVGGSRRDSTSVSSETPGAPKLHPNVERANKAPIDLDALRKKGM